MDDDIKQEQDELNRIQDFDLDAYLDGVEPTHRVQTVNTKGSLLVKYAKVQEQREHAIEQMTRFAETLPDDEDDKTETLSGSTLNEAKAEFDRLKKVIEGLTLEAAQISDEYSQHKARFTFKTPDKSTQARIRALAAKKSKDQNLDDTGLRLMHAAIIGIDILTPEREVKQDLAKWTLAKLSTFLDRIGNGQAKLLMDAYLGLASGEVTPPFSPGF